MPDRPNSTGWRPALLALAMAAFAGPARAQTNPVHVADLVNLPIVDESKSVLGRVRAVVRNNDGKIELLLPLGGLFGFGERLVPVPIESVALAGPQVLVVDMPPHRFQKTPTWYGSGSEMLAAADTVSIARR
jgi:PRC-barrel domain